MNIGSTIKKCRKLKGIQQIQLAESSNLSKSHLSLIENNKREPSLSSINSIADGLGIPLSVLIFLSNPETLNSIDEVQIKNLSNQILQIFDNK